MLVGLKTEDSRSDCGLSCLLSQWDCCRRGKSASRECCEETIRASAARSARTRACYGSADAIYVLFHVRLCGPSPGQRLGDPKIAESRNLIDWKKAGEILPETDYEKNGLVNGRAILLDGQVHLFYNTHGNGPNDAVCHAIARDGLHFARDATDPIIRAQGAWNSGRAIDVDVLEHQGELLLYFATRDPSSKIQMLAVAASPRKSDFDRPNFLGKPIASSLAARNGKIYLFYGGGYNNDPQQIGCAVSRMASTSPGCSGSHCLPTGTGRMELFGIGPPSYFADDDGREYLFYQGNNDHGKTWFISFVLLRWDHGMPVLLPE